MAGREVPAMAVEATCILHGASTACAAIFLLILFTRLWTVRNWSIKTAPGRKAPFKAALGVLLSAILASYWKEASVLGGGYKAIFSASLLFSTLSSLVLSLLLFHEQQWSQNISDLATLYLLTSIFFDTIHLNLPSNVSRHANISHPIILRCCIHSVLLAFQSYSHPSTFSDQKSPEELHGVLSRTFFTWINPILLHGYNNTLNNQDLPPLSEDMKPELTRKAMLQAWSQRAKPETKKSLPWALFKCLKRPFLNAVVPRLFMVTFRYSRPILIKESIKYVSNYAKVSGENRGYWLVISAIVIYVGLALSTALYRHRINKLKLMTRSALVGLIHDKTMKSPSLAYDNGEATTLMSTDADSLDEITSIVHETWAQVVEVLVGIVLLASQVGWIWPLLLFLIYLCSHMSRFVAKHLQPHQKSWNKATQTRIAATSSMLSAMKVDKMIGLQQSFSRRIQELREQELWEASKLRWVMVYYNASANALGIFSPAITLVLFAVISVARGRSLDTETAFTTMAILGMVTHPANMVMTIVPRAVAAFSGFERIQAFLLRPSLNNNHESLLKSTEKAVTSSYSNLNLSKKPTSAIKLCKFQIGDDKPLLKDINLDIITGSLTTISGPTGIGKSTLLRAILGEVERTYGSINLSTRKIAYCAQRPWLPNGTIKDAIYGATKNTGADDNVPKGWYDEVIDQCCLKSDIDSLPDGDQTQIGSRGLNLSGGQRQRVALARALFTRSDILLLDDTFSGLDGGTEQAVFNNLFGPAGLTRRLNTTVVLVSNSTQYFQNADHIVVLGDHGIIDQGNWQNIKIKSASIAKFSATHQTKYNTTLSANFDKLSSQLRAKDETETDLARQSGDLSLYRYYFRFIGNKNLYFLIVATVIYSFFITTPQYWLQLWTQSGSDNTTFYVCGFLLLSTMSWASTSIQMWSVVIRLAPQSGLRLHGRLLDIVTSAPLSYFSNTDNGSILNRFSQDIPLMDKQLPSALQTVTTQIFKLLMQIILLCTAERWLVLSLPPSVILVYIIQKVYLQTSRQLKFLELESRAKVFANFLESVEGLETIRSFGWSEAVTEDNIQSIDHSQRPEFLQLCLQRWLNIVLDLFSAVIATGAIAIAVTYRGHVTGAQVGIALNIMLVTNTTLLNLVGSWTTLETSLGAISRLKTPEEKTPVEGEGLSELEPPENWPCRGHLALKNITASYNSDSVALQNLSLDIKAGQKVIVCGRTGSGKSSLLLTLLRLLELQSGKIELDGIDIKQVSLGLLRQRCFIAVSQDALLLPNETLRLNLDPDYSVPNKVLIDSLTKARLWEHFSGDEKNHVSDDDESASGDHPILDQKISLLQELSVGQCQLFALCRALVKASFLRSSGVKPVVVLDEVTSSLDTSTESTIHRLIDEKFTQEGHTVVIVSHRLGVVKEYTKSGRDTVVLLADGKLQRVIAAEDYDD